MDSQQQLVKREEQAPVQQSGGVPSVYGAVMRVLQDPEAPLDKYREAVSLARELEAAEHRKVYLAAFHSAKTEMDGIKITRRGKIVYPKGGVVRYAKYDDIAKVVKPILRKNNLTSTFTYEYTEHPPKVVCIMKVTHALGHAEEFRSVPMPMIDSGGGKNDVQGAGSVASYGVRFVVSKAFDIVTEDEDDDGSGQGVQEPITDEQVATIEACIETMKGRDPKDEARFLKWLVLAHKTQDIRELTQGPQYDAVMEVLRKKLAEGK